MRRNSARQARLSRRWNQKRSNTSARWRLTPGWMTRSPRWSSELEKAREGHLRYLRHEQLAAGLPQAEQALEAGAADACGGGRGA